MTYQSCSTWAGAGGGLGAACTLRTSESQQPPAAHTSTAQTLTSTHLTQFTCKLIRCAFLRAAFPFVWLFSVFLSFFLPRNHDFSTSGAKSCRPPVVFDHIVAIRKARWEINVMHWKESFFAAIKKRATTATSVMSTYSIQSIFISAVVCFSFFRFLVQRGLKNKPERHL